jgi:DNA-nicking Smr family endonuclease
MSRRRLTKEERALWSGITRSVAPLRASPADVVEADDATPASNKPAKESRADRGATVRKTEKGPPPLAPLGRRMKQRVARGREALDARIDLHGLTQAEAHSALLHFLRRSQAGGAKLVLVITGKGGNPDDDWRERGVLRRQVPLWLRLPEFRGYLVGFETAHPAHGGEGAFYIRLRRRRERH